MKNPALLERGARTSKTGRELDALSFLGPNDNA
jgi:hypothetical protein